MVKTTHLNMGGDEKRRVAFDRWQASICVSEGGGRSKSEGLWGLLQRIVCKACRRKLTLIGERKQKV